MIITNAKHLFRDFVSIIFPEICLNCRDALLKNEKFLCTSCTLALPYSNNHQISENHIFQKFAAFSKVKSASSLFHFHKGGIARKLVHELKYNNAYDLGVWLGTLYAVKLKDLKIDLILPVPLHSRKLKTRGYNQCQAISEGMAAVTEFDIGSDLLIRRENTKSQTKQSKIDRWLNVDEQFSIVNPDKVNGRSILVLDDIITSGATVGSICAVLESEKVQEIHIACIGSGQ